MTSQFVRFDHARLAVARGRVQSDRGEFDINILYIIKYHESD